MTKLIVEKKLIKKDAHAKKIDDSTGESPMKPSMVTSEFSQKMSRTRQLMKWTRKDLAQKAMLPESVIGLYETGKAIRNEKEMNKIQLCLNKAINDFEKSSLKEQNNKEK